MGRGDDGLEPRSIDGADRAPRRRAWEATLVGGRRERRAVGADYRRTTAAVAAGQPLRLALRRGRRSRRPAPPARVRGGPSSARVEVRRVRGGLELRVDGTLASLHRPGGALTGPVWWALAAPVLLARPHRKRRVLLLGLAAGSVARALRALDAEADVVGVDFDAEVVGAARRDFGLDALRVEVVVADAREYLRRERRRFDLVVEDLFVGPSRTVRKPEWLLGEGYGLIARRLARDGVFSSNTIHEMPAVVRAARAFGGRVVSLDVAGHYNRIVVAGPSVPGPRALRRILAADGRLRGMLRRVAVRSRHAAVPSRRRAGPAQRLT